MLMQQRTEMVHGAHVILHKSDSHKAQIAPKTTPADVKN